MNRVLITFLAAVTLGGCGGSYVVDTEQDLFLLTNLRPNARGQMTSVMQWRGTTVLPVCTSTSLLSTSICHIVTGSLPG